MSREDRYQNRAVVTAFLRHAGRVLVVRRSQAVGTYRGRWSAISGYLECAAPLDQALLEVREETGLSESALRLVAEGRPMHLTDTALRTRWTVHPFLFDVAAPDDVELDWENVDLEWIDPARLDTLETVPGLAEAYRHCMEALE